MDSLLDCIMDVVGPLLLIACIVLMAGVLLIGLPVGAYFAWQDSQSPTFELRKDGWVCTASHVETSTIMIQVGKVLVPSTTSSTVCDRWDRRP